MGFVLEELSGPERQLVTGGKSGTMAVVYGKEASIWKVSGLGRCCHAGGPGRWTRKRVGAV